MAALAASLDLATLAVLRPNNTSWFRTNGAK
jgi:hypothetical protein